LPIDRRLKPVQAARWPNKATQTAKSPLEQNLDDLRANEAVGSRHQNTLVQSKNAIFAHGDG